MEREQNRETYAAGDYLPQQILSEIRAYWEALRRGRIAPARSEVDPRGIERALEHAFILERIAPGLGRLRLAGTHLNDLMGMEVRGMPLSALFVPASRPAIADLVELVFQAPAIVEADLRAETMIGKPGMSARLLLLPLASDFGDITRILGCLIAKGEIGHPPRRFELRDSHITRLDDAAALSQARPEAEPPRTSGFAMDATGFVPFRPQRTTATPGGPSASPPTPEERRALFQVIKNDPQRTN